MKTRYPALLAGLMVCAVIQPAAADASSNFALILKTGSFTLSDDSQTIDGGALSFDDKASSVLGAEFEWRQSSGIAFGLEALSYKNDLTATGTTISSTMKTFVLLANAKKYFSPSDSIHPYIGAGIGAAAVDFSGSALTGNAGGLALQDVAGIEFRWEKVGIYTEIKLLSAKTEDSRNEEADASGSGVFGGVSVYF